MSMHVLRQIFWFKVTFITAVVFTILFTVVFAAGVGTVLEADRSTRKVATTLGHLARVQSAVDEAVTEGRRSMLSQGSEASRLATLRERAVQEVDALQAAVAVSQDQTNNVLLLRTTLLERFRIQDEQAALTSRTGESLVVKEGVTRETIRIGADFELGMAKIRSHELQEMFDADVRRSNTQWQVTRLMILFMTVSMTASLVFIMLLISELRYRYKISEQLRQSIHVSNQGETLYSAKDIREIIRVIEHGEMQLAEMMSRK